MDNGNGSDSFRLESKDDKKNIKAITDKSISQKFFLSKKSIEIINIILNTILSIILIVLTVLIFNNYEVKFVIIFYLTFLSLFMNELYIINITILDYICLFNKQLFKKCERYNDFIRNYCLRICFPFSISIVFLYWMLILLGDDFQYASRSLWDNCVSFTFHGLIFIFLLYDTFTYPHINKKNRKLPDFLIITGMIILYFIILGISKYVVYYNPYDFMVVSSWRELTGAGILIYMAIIDGYIAFILIANRFFIQEDDNNDKKNENQIDEKTPLKIKENFLENKKKKENKQIKENGSDIKNKNVFLNILPCPKNINRIKLEPLNLKSKTNNFMKK